MLLLFYIRWAIDLLRPRAETDVPKFPLDVALTKQPLSNFEAQIPWKY